MSAREVAGKAKRGGGFRIPAVICKHQPVVRWLATGFASTLFGGLLTWGTLIEPPGVLLFEMTSGAVGLLCYRIPNDRGYDVFVAVMVIVTAVIYGMIGSLVTVARDRRAMLGPALLTVSLFAIGIIMEFAVRETHHPGRFIEIPREIGQSAHNRDVRFFILLAGLISWQAFVVSSLVRAFLQIRDRQGALRGAIR